MSKHSFDSAPATSREQHRVPLRVKLLGGAALGLTLLGGIVGNAVGLGQNRSASHHNQGPRAVLMTEAQLEQRYSLSAPIMAPDGHSELTIGTALKGGGPGPKATELFVSTDGGAEWQPVVANVTDATWAPASYVENGQDPVFAADYTSDNGPGTPNLESDPNGPIYAGGNTYVGLFEVGPNGAVDELAAAQCTGTKFQSINIPGHGSVTTYGWSKPTRNRQGQTVVELNTYSIIGGTAPDGSTFYGGETDATVSATL